MIVKYVEYHPVCDICSFQNPSDLAQQNPEYARAFAKSAGWEIVGRRCLCPACVLRNSKNLDKQVTP